MWNFGYPNISWTKPQLPQNNKHGREIDIHTILSKFAFAGIPCKERFLVLKLLQVSVVALTVRYCVSTTLSKTHADSNAQQPIVFTSYQTIILDRCADSLLKFGTESWTIKTWSVTLIRATRSDFVYVKNCGYCPDNGYWILFLLRDNSYLVLIFSYCLRQQILGNNCFFYR